MELVDLTVLEAVARNGRVGSSPTPVTNIMQEFKTWKLFVDDERVGPQHDDWDVVQTYESAIQLIREKGLPIEMSLDHDIWIGRIQGSDFVWWLKGFIDSGHNPDENFSYSIHSSNKDGLEYMKEVLVYVIGKEPKHLTQWWN